MAQPVYPPASEITPPFRDLRFVPFPDSSTAATAINIIGPSFKLMEKHKPRKDFTIRVRMTVIAVPIAHCPRLQQSHQMPVLKRKFCIDTAFKRRKIRDHIDYNLDDIFTGKQNHKGHRPRFVNAQDGSQGCLSNIAIGAARAKASGSGRQFPLQLWPRSFQADKMYSGRDQHGPAKYYNR